MKQALITVITGYLIILNLAGFCLMGIDKRRSIKKAWRIPETTLIAVAFLGGGIGSFLGMNTFRHKTKHVRFVVLLPIAAGLYLILLLKLYQIV